jgi:RHS repeat-associated protein
MPTTLYHWDEVSDCVLQESDGAGNIQVTYTNEPSAYGPLLSERRGTVDSQYHFDALGSTRALTDNSQTVTDTFTYDAWGNEVIRSGKSPTTFRWIGQLGYMAKPILDSTVVRHRTCSNKYGQWLARDPLFLYGSLFAYSYASNRPVVFVDPSGLAGISFHFAAFIGGRLGTWLPEPFSPEWEFKTDERAPGQPGTSRIASRGSTDSCEIGTSAPVGRNSVGASHRRRPVYCPYPNTPCYDEQAATAPLVKDFVFKGTVGNCKSYITFRAEATYPFAPQGIAPAIDYNVTFGFDARGDAVTVSVSGRHDAFPDYEAMVDGGLVYVYESIYPGPNFWNLGGGPEIPFSRDVTLRKQTRCVCNGSCG